jgi:hypothetical protein
MASSEPQLPFLAKTYERKQIAFFDVLGWRDEIVRAGSNPLKIGRLALVVEIFSAAFVNESMKAQGVRLSSFSDNVVVTFPDDPDDAAWHLRSLATIQVGLGMLGFMLRGSFTIGDINHDDLSVFGPGLVRAHQLESREAVVPRILIDPKIVGTFPFQNAPIVEEGGVTFLEPFTAEFIDSAQGPALEAVDVAAFNTKFGYQLVKPELPLSGGLALPGIMGHLSDLIGWTSDERAWTKLAWLFDRIAPRVKSSINATMLPTKVPKKTLFQEPTHCSPWN